MENNYSKYLFLPTPRKYIGNCTSCGHPVTFVPVAEKQVHKECQPSSPSSNNENEIRLSNRFATG